MHIVRTESRSQLRHQGIDTLVIAGGAMSVCESRCLAPSLVASRPSTTPTQSLAQPIRLRTLMEPYRSRFSEQVVVEIEEVLDGWR